jgi:3-oxoacyl-[acyl-carrier protein] reductase
MAKKLEGKVAVVTGASKGIGAQIARRFAEEGAKVVVNYASSADGANKVVADIQAHGGEAIAVKADMSKREDVERLFVETNKSFGTADVLVNNAGIYQFAPLEEINEQHFASQFNLNVLGLIYATQEAVKQFGPTGGNIINISSVVGHTPAPGASVYSATKAAVESLTRSHAFELTGRARVNAIAPGMVKTEGVEALNAGDDFENGFLSKAIVKRLGTPDDIAKAAVYLASEDSSWVSGESLVVGGGARM